MNRQQRRALYKGSNDKESRTLRQQIRVLVEDNSVVIQLIGPAGIGTQIGMSPRMTLGVCWVLIKASWMAWRNKPYKRPTQEQYEKAENEDAKRR